MSTNLMDSIWHNIWWLYHRKNYLDISKRKFW